LKSSGINIADGILVNEFLETSQEGIYSAGDVCQSYDRVRKQRRLNPLWPVAVEQGKHAALSMAGKMTSYKGSFSRNILQVFGHTIISAGVHKDDAIKIFRQYENNRYAAIYTIDGCMIGFTFINLNVKVGAYLTAIKKSLNIYNLKDILLTGSLSYEHLGASYLPE
jgi:NADPH-dependent 2,4-dienoyl-CoA reductase/sulfur reductase-like enzyme